MKYTSKFKLCFVILLAVVLSAYCAVSFAAFGDGGAFGTTQQALTKVGTSIKPSVDDAYDLGSPTKEWRNLYIDGTAYIDTLEVGALTGANVISQLDTNVETIDAGTGQIDFDVDGGVQMRLTADELTLSTGNNFIIGTTTWNSSDGIDGEVIADDTIDDDSIDFTDVTLLDFGLATTHDTAGELDALYEGELDNEAGLYSALSDVTNFLQSTDALDGEVITDDTIDDDSIDFTDVTLADFGLAATHDTAGELDALYLPADAAYAEAFKTDDTWIEYYIATTGNDTTGDGSSGSPWLTLSKAISEFPKYVDAQGDVGFFVSVGAGTFTESSVDITNFSAPIWIEGEGASSSKLDFNIKLLNNTTRVIFGGLEFEGSLTVENAKFVSYSTKHTGGSVNAIYLVGGGIAYIRDCVAGASPCTYAFGGTEGNNLAVYDGNLFATTLKNPGINDVVVLDSSATYLTSTGALDGELITDDTIDDDSIDFTDVTLADFGLAATHDTAGELDALYQAAGSYQPLEATLTDIADGTIAEDLVNTANPWAVNEVHSDLLTETEGDAAYANALTGTDVWIEAYVTKAGNDSTGDGTPGNPYLTIQKAVDEMPRFVDGDGDCALYIDVGAGTFSETVTINGFVGSLWIQGAGITSTAVSRFDLYHNVGRVLIAGVEVGGDTHAFLVSDSSNVIVDTVKVGGSTNAFYTSASSKIYVKDVTNGASPCTYGFTDSNQEGPSLVVYDGNSFGSTLKNPTNGENLTILDGSATYITNAASLIPAIDDTYYLGEIASPFKAYKALVLKDTTDGKHYKIEVISGTVTATALD